MPHNRQIVNRAVIIPQDTIEEVKARTDIVDVVGDYVRLKKRGSNFVGLCPFHTEKTPSFNVNPARDIYKCFGCGVGGDVFNFLSEVEGLSFPESVRVLADRAGITIPDEQVADGEASEVDSIYQGLRFAARIFFRNLTQTESGGRARNYLENRGFTADSVKKFGLGYANDAWDGLLKEAEKARFSSEQLTGAGLVIPRKKGDGFYDRYRNRIIFPITSHVGKILGFGGRVLDSADEPKYINSPETLVYNKSRVLYGLYQARNAIRKREEALLVEGYTDVIALHQAGIENAVATCGTALTQDQIRLLSRYSNHIVLLYDADSAGVRAAFRAIDLILESGIGASAVALPTGEDPDSFVTKHGADAFNTYLKTERNDIVHFIMVNAKNAGKMDTPEGHAGVQRTILRSISKIPDPLVKESYIKLASEVMGIPDLQLRQVLREFRSSPKKKRAAKTGSLAGSAKRNGHHAESTDSQSIRSPTSSDHRVAAGSSDDNSAKAESVTDIIMPAEKTLFGIMLRDGSPLVEFIMSQLSISDFSEGISRKMATRIISMYENGVIEVDGLIEGKFGDELRRLSTEVLTHHIEPSENWSLKKNISVPALNEEARESAASAMTLLKLDRIDGAIRRQKDRIYKAQEDPESTRVLAEEMMVLNEMRKKIQERKFINGV